MNVIKVSKISVELTDGAAKQLTSTLMCFMFKKQQGSSSSLSSSGVSTDISVLVRFIHPFKRHGYLIDPFGTSVDGENALLVVLLPYQRQLGFVF